MLFGHIHSTKEKLYGLFNLHVQLDVTIGVIYFFAFFCLFHVTDTFFSVPITDEMVAAFDVSGVMSINNPIIKSR